MKLPLLCSNKRTEVLQKKKAKKDVRECYMYQKRISGPHNVPKIKT